MTTVRLRQLLLMVAVAILVLSVASSVAFAQGGGGGGASGGGGAGAGASSPGSTPNANIPPNTWSGAAIMPKSELLQIQRGSETVGGIYDVAWPAVVTKTNGRWLWIQDDGGYSNPPVAGWVYADDVVRLEAATDHYNQKLLENKTAVLYWLRGICWESQNQPAVAIEDYKAARAVGPLTIDDVAIRYGRLLAAEQMQNGFFPYQPSIPPPDKWVEQFQDAEAVNNRRPQLYFEWGMAYADICRCELTASQAQDDAHEAARKARSVTEFYAKFNPQVAEFYAKFKPQVGATNDSVKSGGTDNQGEKVRQAKDLSDNLAGFTSIANQIYPELIRLAQRSSEFGAVPKHLTKQTDPLPAAPPKIPPKPAGGPHITAPKDTDPAVQTSLDKLTVTVNRAADANAYLQWAIAAALGTEEQNIDPPRALAEAREAPAKGKPEEVGIDPSAASALEKLAIARDRSPSWWRVPMAIGELVLSHCEHKTPEGELQAQAYVSGEFRAALTQSPTRPSRAANELPPPQDPQAIPLPHDKTLKLAEKLFIQVIALNPNSIDAYRERAEVLWLRSKLEIAANKFEEASHDLSTAQAVATQACVMGNYRQPGSLITLSQIDKGLGKYEPAADLAARALSFLSPEDQPLVQSYWETVDKLAQQTGIELGEKKARADYPELSELAGKFGLVVQVDGNSGRGDNLRGEEGSSNAEPRVIRRPRRWPSGFKPRSR